MSGSGLRVGVVGTGALGSHHARVFAGLDNAKLTMVFDLDPSKALAVGAPLGAAVAANLDAFIASVDAAVVAVPTLVHAELAAALIRAGRHVLVEKPAFPGLSDYEAVRTARDAAGRVILVGENDHYKPLVRTLQRLIAADVIGEMVFAHFSTIAHRLKAADDWRNDETMAGGDAFFEEGIHWLHIAGSLGPKIVTARGYRPEVSRAP